jgi:hypothetical protein
MSRQTCRARDLTDDSYIFHHDHNEIRHIAKAYTVGDRTYLIYAAGAPGDFEADGVVALATEGEIAAYRREQDRFAVARALTRLGSQICDKELPVPPGGVGIVVSLYLADDADLGPWADYLSARPRRGTALPLIQADAEGVEINVYRSGEFGPDLADAALTESVEHRDSVGAFPVVAQSRTSNDTRPFPSYDPNPTLAMRVGGDLNEAYASYARSLDTSNPGWQWDDMSRMAGGLAHEADKRRAAGRHPLHPNAPKPAPDGWPISDGHRPPVDDEAMKQDRHSGEG